jgi:hypothetical protein
MKAKLLIIAGVLFLATTPVAFAYDVTSDPDATMNQQQKMGPSVRSYQAGNRIITLKGPYYRHHYAHYRYRR